MFLRLQIQRPFHRNSENTNQSIQNKTRHSTCEVNSPLIMHTRPCDLHPITSHFYIVKLGFTEVYICFLFLLKTDRGYKLQPPQIYVLTKIKKYTIFHLKILIFRAVKNRSIFHRLVIVICFSSSHRIGGNSQKFTIGECESKAVRNAVFDCKIVDDRRQIAIEKYVFICVRRLAISCNSKRCFVIFISVLDCRLSGVF